MYGVRGAKVHGDNEHHQIHVLASLSGAQVLPTYQQSVIRRSNGACDGAYVKLLRQ